MSDDQTHQATEPVQCTRGCGFFGNPATGGMCSKCARDESQATVSVSSPRPAPMSTPPSPAIAASPSPPIAATTIFTSPPKPTAAAAIPAPGSPVPVASVTRSPATPSDVGEAGGALAGDSATPSPSPRPQKRKDRCYVKGCKAKLSMVDQQTNKCMCGFVFCGKHRHAEEHDCSADHLGAGRAKIAKENERIVNDKVQNRL